MQCSFSDCGLPAQVAALHSRLLPLDDPGESSGALTGYREAAVLVLLFGPPDGIRFLLTERPSTLPRHPGQISLPGGAREPQDATLWHTAIRETGEELGLDGDSICPLGRLPTVGVRVSRYAMAPFVGWAAREPVLRPNPHEVAAILEVPVSALLDPELVRTEHWDVRGLQRPVTYYRMGEWKVWGATARVLSDLARVLGATLGDPAPGWVGPAP